MKKIFTLFAFLLLSITSFAYDFIVDDIAYTITSSANLEVKVDYNNKSDYRWEDIVIPSTVTYENLSYAVTSIGNNAFEYSRMHSVTIGNSVKTIEVDAFYRCESLCSVTIGNSVTTIEFGAFMNCKNLSHVTIGSSVKYIGDDAFCSCKELKSIDIPNSVETIGFNAFWGCKSLEYVTIGNSVKTIGYSAFRFCENLKEVTCYAEEVPSMGNTVFSSSEVRNSTLKVPEKSLGKYKAAQQWNYFGTIKAIESTGINAISVESDKQPVKKYIENGKVFINNGKDIYNTAGQIQK